MDATGTVIGSVDTVGQISCDVERHLPMRLRLLLGIKSDGGDGSAEGSNVVVGEVVAPDVDVDAEMKRNLLIAHLLRRTLTALGPSQADCQVASQAGLVADALREHTELPTCDFPAMC